MEITRRASKGFVLNQVSKLAEYFFMLLFSMVAARGLGDTEYGRYSFIVSMSSLVILFSSIGLDETINVFMPKLREEKRRASFFFKRLLVTRLVSSAVAGGLYYLFAGRLAALFGAPALAPYFRLSVLYIITANLSSFFLAYFISRIDLGVVAVARIAGSGASLCAVYVLLRMGYGIREIIIVSILVALCVLAAYVLKALSFMRVPGEVHPLGRVYRFGFTIWLTMVLDYALGKQIDIILLQYFGVEAALIGYYNIAFSMYRFLASFILAGLGGIGLASISEIARKHGDESTANAWSILTKFSIAVILPVMVFTIVHAREIIRALYSEEFMGAAVMLQVAMLFGMPVRLLGGGTNIGVLFALGRERAALYCKLAAGLSNLCLDCVLIPDHIGPVRCAGLGPMGAIVATLGTGAAMHVVEFVLVRRMIRIEYPWRFCVKVVAASIVAVALSWRAGAATVPGVLCAGAIFLLAYGFLVVVLRPLSSYDAEVMSRVLPGFVKMLKKWNILFGNE